jgi:lipoprotein NlpI
VQLFSRFSSLLLAVFLVGCASSNHQPSSATARLIIAEPLEITRQSEVALARLTEIIQRVEVTDQQKAKLYYERGVIYDSVGLRNLARLDFNRAIRHDPEMVDAYNFIGIHYVQEQEFIQAYDAFDAAIELKPEHEYAYLNRGIALYYGVRPELAVEDFGNFLQHDKSDPYRIIWLYLAQYQIDPAVAKANLVAHFNAIEHKAWANLILLMFLDEISEQEFIQRIPQGVSSNKQLAERLCEAYFYLGKYNLMKGELRQSANFFKLALTTNVYEFVEHRYAKLELDLLRQQNAIKDFN